VRTSKQGRRHGESSATCDDFVVLVHGNRDNVGRCRTTSRRCSNRSGLRLSPARPGFVHRATGSTSGVPHPVAPQIRHEEVVRLHFIADRPVRSLRTRSVPLTRRTRSETRVRADQVEPGHARMGQLFPTCVCKAHAVHPRQVRLATGDSGGLSQRHTVWRWKDVPATSPPRTGGGTSDCGRDRVVQPGQGADHAGTVTGANKIPVHGPLLPDTNGRFVESPYRELVRRVRRAA